MEMDKEIALIFEYENAPAELKTAAAAHHQNCLALAAAKQANAKAQANLAAAQIDYDSTNQSFRAALKGWNPKTGGVE